jgi:sugar (pentulose or hexulose) kinase
MQADRSDAPLAIGIDLGTQSVRVALLGEDGTRAASGTAPFSSIRTEGVRHEQDPKALGQAAHGAAEYLGGREVAGLAICSTSGTVLFADGGGKPLTPALMYNDGRAEEEARVAQEAGEEVWDSLGYRMQRSFALPKLLWRLHAGMGEGASRLMHQADFVASRLASQSPPTRRPRPSRSGPV